MYVQDILPIVSNVPGNACFKATVSWAAGVDQVDVSVTLGFGDLSYDLGFIEGGQGLMGLRVGLVAYCGKGRVFVALCCQ